MRERRPNLPGIEVGKAMNRKLALGTLMMISLLVVLVAAPARTSSQTTVYVAPSTITATVGQTLFVGINISDVIDLYGWEFKLRWDPTVLEALNVIQGDFLISGGETYPTYPGTIKSLNNTEGCLRAVCTLLYNVTGVNGSGTLAIVEFKVESEGESVLDLYDTKLVNSLEQPIDHATKDGKIKKPVGGIWIPVDKLALLIPYICLTLTISIAAVATGVLVKRRKKKQ